MLEAYNDVMSVLDVSNALYVGKGTVYSLLDSGDLKGFKIGKNWKIPKVAVENYILESSKISKS